MEKRAFRFEVQMAESALRYLHGKGVIEREKTTNLVKDKGQLEDD